MADPNLGSEGSEDQRDQKFSETGVDYLQNLKWDEVMSASRHYDTVAFDVRDDVTMLFFARTSAAGDIEDYLLLMRTEGDDLDDVIVLEINEQQFAGGEIIAEAKMSGNMLTLVFREDVKELEGVSEMVLTFDDSPENRTSMEAGAFKVLGEKLTGGHA